jgi:ABC-type oligopeptide transport system ATPase subunit
LHHLSGGQRQRQVNSRIMMPVPAFINEESSRQSRFGDC